MLPKDQPRHPPETKTVGIWIRVSTEDQAKGESPEHHEKRARFYAESKDWRIVEVYHLEAVSGKSVMGQPETQRMLDDVKHGRITGLIFSKLARLARNTRELLQFADLFREHNADLISLQEAIDTSTPAGRFFYTVIAAMAEWEREEIAERVAASVPIRAKLGKPLGGAAPFGYRWENRTLMPDPVEAPIRKLMYELFLIHRRKRTVAKTLSDQGHRTRKGSKFTDTAVERLIRDPTAKGVRRANYTKATEDGRRWVLKPRDQWVLLPVEPIVPVELWEQCNGILDGRKQSGKRPARKPVQLFGGLTVCSCGSKMYVPSKSRKYVCSKCRNKIGVEDMEVVFQEQLKNFLLSPTDVLAYLSGADKTIKDKEILLVTLEEERRRLTVEMDRVYRAYVDGNLTSDGFGKLYGPLEDRNKQIDDQIPALQGEVDFLKIQHLSSDQILSEARDLYSRWGELDFEAKRQVIENVVDKVVVGKDDVTIELCYLPSPSEITAKRQRSHPPALPFCRLTLKGPKPRNLVIPKSLITIGDHIRTRRVELGLTQQEVACQIGVHPWNVWSWENGLASPHWHYWADIIGLLGYDPFPAARTVGERLVRHRRLLGLSRETAAVRLGVDPKTLATWERGERKPTKVHLEQAMAFIAEAS